MISNVSLRLLSHRDGPKVKPEIDDLIVVMIDTFRNTEGEYGVADVVAIHPEHPWAIEVEQHPDHGRGGRCWVRLCDAVLLYRGPS